MRVPLSISHFLCSKWFFGIELSLPVTARGGSRCFSTEVAARLALRQVQCGACAKGVLKIESGILCGMRSRGRRAKGALTVACANLCVRCAVWRV